MRIASAFAEEITIRIHLGEKTHREMRTSPRSAITTPVTMGSLKSLIMIRVVESSKMMGSPSCESGPWRLFLGRNCV